MGSPAPATPAPGPALPRALAEAASPGPPGRAPPRAGANDDDRAARRRRRAVRMPPHKDQANLAAGVIDKFGRVVDGVKKKDSDLFHTIDYARAWRERVRHEKAITIDHAPYRLDTRGGRRTWLEPVKPQHFDPSARPATVGATSTSTFADAFKTFAKGDKAPRQRYVYAATTAQEIGWLRTRAGHGGPGLRRVSFARGRSHAREYCDVTKVYKACVVAPCVPRDKGKPLDVPFCV